MSNWVVDLLAASESKSLTFEEIRPSTVQHISRNAFRILRSFICASSIDFSFTFGSAAAMILLSFGSSAVDGRWSVLHGIGVFRLVIGPLVGVWQAIYQKFRVFLRSLSLHVVVRSERRPQKPTETIRQYAASIELEWCNVCALHSLIDSMGACRIVRWCVMSWCVSLLTFQFVDSDSIHTVQLFESVVACCSLVARTHHSEILNKNVFYCVELPICLNLISGNGNDSNNVIIVDRNILPKYAKHSNSFTCLGLAWFVLFNGIDFGQRKVGFIYSRLSLSLSVSETNSWRLRCGQRRRRPRSLETGTKCNVSASIIILFCLAAPHLTLD